jgi:hypothetical protein
MNTYILIMFIQWGGAITIPGYDSLAACESARQQATATLVDPKGNSVVPFHAACVKGKGK